MSPRRPTLTDAALARLQEAIVARDALRLGAEGATTVRTALAKALSASRDCPTQRRLAQALTACCDLQAELDNLAGEAAAEAQNIERGAR